MNIVLCGMMGCGKTTVASALSKLYNLERVDTDELIVSRYGEINGIFAEHGEEYFRDLESGITAEVSEKYENAVISLGGGCVLRKENVDCLKKSGKIFYLRAKAETLIKRVEGDTSRPLLKGGADEKIRAILAKRASVYENAADFIIDTDELTPECIACIVWESVK